MILLLSVILIALIFEFINGFHDTANSIATVVSTKVLTPRAAIALASLTNLIGAMWGTAVAKTIASGLVDARYVTSEVIIAALVGGIGWNLITWRVGLPSSSSHALIGGLCGATLAAANNNLDVIIWSEHTGAHWYQWKGILWKVIVPMIVSPFLGFIVGWLIMALLYIGLRPFRPKIINTIFGKLQIISAAAMGFMHGTNDAQKTMGIIALALLAATQAGTLADNTLLSNFLRVEVPKNGHPAEIAFWVKLICAVTMAWGTAMGGWRIIRTLGQKMVKLQPINGFAAETSSSAVLFAASSFGIPVSTTHNITASILGVGSAKNPASVSFLVVERILWAWLFTLPCSAALSWTSIKFLANFSF